MILLARLKLLPRVSPLHYSKKYLIPICEIDFAGDFLDYIGDDGEEFVVGKTKEEKAAQKAEMEEKKVEMANYIKVSS